MELFLGGQYSSHELHKLNYCRMYLKVLRLSDITSSDSNTVQQGHWDGTEQNIWSMMTWSIQSRSNEESWSVWKTALAKYCQGNTVLVQPLAAWYVEGMNLFQWRYDPVNRVVLHWGDTSWEAFGVNCTRRHMVIDFASKRNSEMKLENTWPVTEKVTETVPRCSLAVGRAALRDTIWLETIQQKGIEKSTNICPREIRSSMSSTQELFMTTNIWMVIDGGVTDRMGCFGWVIATDSRIIYEHSDITTRNSK